MMRSAIGEHGRSRMADANLTPMIDILLVLLVVFLLAQPLLQRSIDVQIPVQEGTPGTLEVAPIVLEIDADGLYHVNREPVPAYRLTARLREIYRDRPDRVLFVSAHDDVIYQSVITAMDAAREAGVEVLGAVLGPR